MAERDRAKPKYRQIADDLRVKIDRGEYEADAQLPTKAALMDQYGVALNTVERAMEVLRGLGLAETFQGVGTFARRPLDSGATDGERLAELERRVARLETQMLDVCANLGISVHRDQRVEDAAAEAAG